MTMSLQEFTHFIWCRTAMADSPSDQDSRLVSRVYHP